MLLQTWTSVRRQRAADAVTSVSTSRVATSASVLRGTASPTTGAPVEVCSAASLLPVAVPAVKTAGPLA